MGGDRLEEDGREAAFFLEEGTALGVAAWGGGGGGGEGRTETESPGLVVRREEKDTTGQVCERASPGSRSPSLPVRDTSSGRRARMVNRVPRPRRRPCRKRSWGQAARKTQKRQGAHAGCTRTAQRKKRGDDLFFPCLVSPPPRAGLGASQQVQHALSAAASTPRPCGVPRWRSQPHTLGNSALSSLGQAEARVRGWRQSGGRRHTHSLHMCVCGHARRLCAARRRLGSPTPTLLTFLVTGVPAGRAGFLAVPTRGT